jgi:threonine dehydrogenase-like Zn-dependent dehydrogenase
MRTRETMKAAVTSEYGKIEWLDVPLPTITDDEVLVQVGFANICGSDMHVFHGEWAHRTSTPTIQGHEFAGTVVEIGKNIKDVAVGDRVVVDPIESCGKCPACAIGHIAACMSLKLIGIEYNGGFGQYVAAKEFMIYKVGSEISDLHAAMVEVLSIGFHACRRAGVKEGDELAIFSAGRVGQSILQAAQTKTRERIFVVDVLDERLQVAAGAFDNVVPVNALHQDPVAFIKEQTGGKGVEVAFEAVGHAVPIEGQPNPVRSAIQSMRGGGTTCVLGLYEHPLEIHMKEIIWKEGKLVASRVSHGEFADAIREMSAGHLKPEVMISKVLPASQTMEAFRLLEEDPKNHIKISLDLNCD